MDIIDNFKHLSPLDRYFYEDPSYKKHIIRRAKIMLFNGVLNNYEPYRNLPCDKQTELLSLIEKSCYNASIEKSHEQNFIPTWNENRFVHVYNTIIYRVSKSLDCESDIKSDYLVKAVLNKTINIKNIGNMSIDELCPNANLETKRHVENRRKQQISYKVFTMYECENCGKSETYISRKQIRSQDEGSSTICTCVYCNHRWIIL